MESVAIGQMGKLVFAHLEPEEDLYEAILTTAEQAKIKTGLILAVTGGLSKVRLTTPKVPGRVDLRTGIIEIEGTSEIHGTGYIGQTVDSLESSTGGASHKAGEPYIHLHVSIGSAQETHCGHLVSGCKVRSLYPKSHFTIVLAEVLGIDLSFHLSEERTETYPQGLPYHVVRQVQL